MHGSNAWYSSIAAWFLVLSFLILIFSKFVFANSQPEQTANSQRTHKCILTSNILKLTFNYCCNQKSIGFLFSDFQTSDIALHRRRTCLEGLPIFVRDSSDKLFLTCLVSTVWGFSLSHGCTLTVMCILFIMFYAYDLCKKFALKCSHNLKINARPTKLLLVG